MIYHNPIILNNITLSYPQKTCFTNFSAKICYGEYIVIIGQNGCGKSQLLKIIRIE
jgi:ABC-type cobalamin/Fe3+-siderophores transport system ATPase subunit